MSALSFLWSFRGRFGRAHYWLAAVFQLVAFFAIVFLAILIASAMAHIRSGKKRAEVLAELFKGREIMAALVAISPNNPEYAKDLAWFDAQIARNGGQVAASPQS